MNLLYQGENIKKYYGKNLVLDIPRFSLAKGAALVLEGANGSGKSTFLRLLAFLEAPSSGFLSFPSSPQPRLECTLLLQEPWLLHETVFTNVTLGLKFRGIKINLKQKFIQAMNWTGFANPEEFSSRKPQHLSGGEKQRVALASRLIFNPAVLLLDEPTAHVDAASAKHIIKALAHAKEAGTTIICATHDLELGKKLGAQRMLMVKPA